MEAELSEFSVFDFDDILDATDNFSEENKLGEGGFGPVYKVVNVKMSYILHSCPSCRIFLIYIYRHYGRVLLCRVPKHTAKPYMHTAKALPCAR